MGFRTTMKGDRVQIALFGRRNAGKSSIINAITGQETAIVSEVKGTTTDPVSKAMEILPIGPCMLIDTPGIDDEGELGKKRIERAVGVLQYADLALLVVDITQFTDTGCETSSSEKDLSDSQASNKNNKIKLPEQESRILDMIADKKIPVVIVLNHSDKISASQAENIRAVITDEYPVHAAIVTSAVNCIGIDKLKNCIVSALPKEDSNLHIVSDLISEGDRVVLVVPVDSAAPKGRLIMPQQQVIRDILDNHAMAAVVQVPCLKGILEDLAGKVKMVITDSQAFKEVDAIVPKDVMLTSFSILFARHKGDLQKLVEGVTAVSKLKDGDTVLIAEGCTHHRQCDDIGTVKIPKWLKSCTGKEINIETCSGASFPSDLSKYSMVIHCGGCTLPEKEMKHRIYSAGGQGVPIVNYGIFIAYANGILKRSVEPFPDIYELL